MWCMYSIFSVKSDFWVHVAQQQGVKLRCGVSRVELR